MALVLQVAQLPKLGCDLVGQVLSLLHELPRRGLLGNPQVPFPLLLGIIGGCLKNANLCLLATAVWHSNIKRACIGHVQRCSSPLRCINFAYKSVVVRVGLLKDADSALATGDVDALILRVVEDVVGITRRVEAGYRLASVSVENNQLGGASSTYKQTVVAFIQSQGEILRSIAQR